MKNLKEKTQPQKEIERLKSKQLSDEIKESLRKKEVYINKPFTKGA